MCGRYHFRLDCVDEMEGLVEQAGWKLELGLLDKDIHPGDMAPVIIARENMGGGDHESKNHGESVLQVQMQRWGFPAPGGKGLIFNARSESAAEKPMFREGVGRRRAAIAASWFYEWNKSKEKYTFTSEKGRVLFLAGFYNQYEDGAHFVILTTEANPSMAQVHSRMPLVLEKELVEDWILDSSRTKELLGQIPRQLSKSCEYEQQTLF